MRDALSSPSSSGFIPAEPVRRWLEDEVVPRYGTTLALSSVLAARSGLQPKSWMRFFIRLRSRSRINFFTLDRLCCLLDEHVSRFCDMGQFLETEEVGQ